MKKNKKIIIIVITMVLIVSFIILLLTQNLEKKLKTQLKQFGYENETSTLYVQENSEIKVNECVNMLYDCDSQAYYFNTEEYLLFKKKVSRKSSVFYELLPIYDFSNNTLSYTYRIQYQNGVVILKGEYNTESDYLCSIEYSYGIDIKNDYYMLCDAIKPELESFKKYANNMFLDQAILNAMKK